MEAVRQVPVADVPVLAVVLEAAAAQVDDGLHVLRRDDGEHRLAVAAQARHFGHQREQRVDLLGGESLEQRDLVPVEHAAGPTEHPARRQRPRGRQADLVEQALRMLRRLPGGGDGGVVQDPFVRRGQTLSGDGGQQVEPEHLGELQVVSDRGQMLPLRHRCTQPGWAREGASRSRTGTGVALHYRGIPS